MSKPPNFRVKIEGLPSQEVFAETEKEARQIAIDNFKKDGIKLEPYLWVRTIKIKL